MGPGASNPNQQGLPETDCALKKPEIKEESSGHHMSKSIQTTPIQTNYKGLHPSQNRGLFLPFGLKKKEKQQGPGELEVLLQSLDLPGFPNFGGTGHGLSRPGSDSDPIG